GAGARVGAPHGGSETRSACRSLGGADVTSASARSSRAAVKRSARWAAAWVAGVAVWLAPALAGAAPAAHAHDGGMASRPLVLILAMAALSLIPFAFLM